MTILSDVSIKQLCIIPDEYFDELRFNQAIMDQNGKGWPLTPHAMDTMIHQLRRQHSRAWTDEERANWPAMITPFHPELVRRVESRDVRGGDLVVDERKIISKGLTSYGYDVSLSNKEVKLFTNINSTEIDPKRLDDRCLVDATIRTDVDGAEYVVLPPNSYLLGHTVEYFRMPRDIIAVCLGKSTYARAGVLVNVTPIEPGFEGNVVIEVGNSTGLPVRIYLNEGISQFLFFRGDRPCEISYGDRGGKYQGQTGVTLPRV